MNEKRQVAILSILGFAMTMWGVLVRDEILVTVGCMSLIVTTIYIRS